VKYPLFVHGSSKGDGKEKKNREEKKKIIWNFLLIFTDLMKNENERGRMRKTPNLNGSFNRNKNGELEIVGENNLN